MKSIKPGRGTSIQGAIASIGAVAFGIFWMIFAARMGAPVPFVLMGLVFVVIAGSNAVMSLRNATGKNRYSVYDITEEGEEIDPLQQRFDMKQADALQSPKEEDTVEEKGGFCPYCGAKAEADYAFCRKCGKKLYKSV